MGRDSMNFSVDTVRFDTVMHSQMSSMRRVALRNDGVESRYVERIWLKGSRADAFSLTVDGLPHNEFRGGTIAAGDSLIMVFMMYTTEYEPDKFERLDVEVVVEGDAGKNVLPIRGWNAGWSKLDSIIDSEEVVPAGGIRYVSEVSKVRAGGKLVLGAGATLIFGKGGLLQIEGSFETRGDVGSRVSLLPQRMEPYYMRKPGQWQGIVVDKGSRGLYLSHTDVRGAVNGVVVQGAPVSGDSVCIKDSRILYSSQDGLRLVGVREAKVVGTILGQNYRHGVALHGSKIELVHCTICTESMSPQVQMGEGLWLDDGEGSASAEVVNSIIWGERKEEVGQAGGGGPRGRLRAVGSVLKVSQEHLSGVQMEGCTSEDPVLELRAQGQYLPGKRSSARHLGVKMDGYAFDLFGVERGRDTPDAGAVACR